MRPLSRCAEVVAAAVVVVHSASLLAPSTAWADALTPESGGLPANEIDALYKLVLYLALAVFVGVEVMLAYSLIAFRARRGRAAAQIRGNTHLEIGWTAAAALLVVVITVITFTKLDGIVSPPSDAPKADGSAQRPLRVKVIGQQYLWSFHYPNGVVAYGEMVVPVRRTVKLEIVSTDVIHSWWIPALGGKDDAVPGSTNYSWFRVSHAGRFRGQCSEFCGRNHADMIAYVRAVPPASYEAWLAKQRRDLDRARKLAAAQAPQR